jgi:hypothetical protein
VNASGFTGGFTPLNGNQYVVTVLSGTTLTIPVDGSAYAAWVSGGTLTRVSTGTDGTPGGGWDPGYSIP